jgi:hypothetical protein
MAEFTALRSFGLALILAVIAGATGPAFGQRIPMPAGSKAWMMYEAGVCPDANGDDCLGSNTCGLNPPNGIPLTTFGSAGNTATGYAEILTGSIRIYARAEGTIGVWGSFEDTYTIVGSASGPFNIPVEFRVTGEAKSVPAGPFHQLVVANSFAKIGTFSPHTEAAFSEDIRVSPFNPAAYAEVILPTESSSTPFTRPFDISANYTVQNVNVGDTFTLAYSTKARASRGEFDMLAGGGVISFDLPPGVGLVSSLAFGSINLVGDARDEFNLPWVNTVTGDLVITDNPNLTTVNVADLVTVVGSLEISENPNTGTLDLGSVESVGGAVNVAENGSIGSLDLGSLESVAGNLTINENSNMGTLNLASLDSVTGSLTITDNGNASVNLADSAAVTGSLTLETSGAGTGTLVLDDVDVGGDTSITADGYTTVDAATADGTTIVTMNNNAATMEVTLPDGAFTSATPVAFSITNEPGSTETIDGNTVTHLGTYNFEFAISTLNSAAELNFEIDLAAMDSPDRQSLLDALDDDAILTLGVIGDAPAAELQLFDVCAGGGPVVDSCVVVQWLDENRMLLDPQGVIDPSFLRLEGLVGHFSTYSFVAVMLDGDYNHDGVVDAADYVVWRKNDGTQEGYDRWRANFGAQSLAIGAGSGSSSNVTAPEPATLVLLMLAAVVRCLRQGRTA